MILFLLYFVFLTIFSVLGGLVGYAADARYPGSGSMVTVAIFMIALWGAWTISVRLTERYWPDRPTA
jgi:uncharacterized membrane protein (DUF4010 family)